MSGLRGQSCLDTMSDACVHTSTQPINGLLASGSLKSDNISGTAQEKTHSVKELKKKADQGDLYILVNTTAHPDGELRGQFQKNS